MTARPAGAWAALTRLEAAVGAKCSGVALARESNQITLRGRQAHKPAPRATVVKQNRDRGKKAKNPLPDLCGSNGSRGGWKGIGSGPWGFLPRATR